MESSESAGSLIGMSDDLFSVAGMDFSEGSQPSVSVAGGRAGTSDGDASGSVSNTTGVRKARNVQAGVGRVGKIVPGYDKIIATDGACSGNPGPGGWAWVEQISGMHASGGEASTTNNIMELTALIEALIFAGPECSLLIRSDSQYALNVMTTWAKGWRKRGWKKADKKPVANLELVKELLELYEGRTGRTDVEWVKGHAGDEANELCDRLAVKQSQVYAG